MFQLLDVARDLGIKGLSQEDTQEQNQEHVQKNRKKKKNKIPAEKTLDMNSQIGISSIKTERLQIQASENIVDYSKTLALESSDLYKNCSETNKLSETINQEKDNMNGHECTSCGKSYSIKYALTRHVKEKHTNESSFSCSECDWNGPRQYLLASHTKSAHGIL